MASGATCETITASPKALVDYLLDHRFENNAAEAAQFLLQAIDQLPDVEKISAELMNEADDEGADSDAEGGEGLGEIQKLPSPTEDDEAVTEMMVSATTPRTKLTLSAHANGIVFVSPKDEKIVLTPEAVKHVVLFPKREECLKKLKRSKDGNHLLIPGNQLLVLLNDDMITFRNKKLSQICLQLPQHLSEQVDLPESPPPSEQELINVCVDNFEEQIIQQLTSSLQLKNKFYRVYNPKHHNVEELSSYTFQSDDGGANSIMQGQMPYLKCYHGVNDGVIYPLEEGLLFFKPPLFIHRSELHSIAVGRGGGSRYIDLHATLDSSEEEKTEIEFTNIDREEMTVLNSYIHKTLVPAMAKDAAEGESDDGEDSEDMYAGAIHEEVDGTNDNTAGATSRKRGRRQAAAEARKATKYELNQKDEEEDSDDDDDEIDEDGDYQFVEKPDDDEVVEESESDEDDEDFEENGEGSDATVSEGDDDDDDTK